MIILALGTLLKQVVSEQKSWITKSICDDRADNRRAAKVSNDTWIDIESELSLSRHSLCSAIDDRLSELALDRDFIVAELGQI